MLYSLTKPRQSKSKTEQNSIRKLDSSFGNKETNKSNFEKKIDNISN